MTGSAPLSDGMAIIAAHVDSPRLDLKQNPLYEEVDLAMLKVHYYGGIRKYQWLARPLALYGTVIGKDGRAREQIEDGLEKTWGLIIDPETRGIMGIYSRAAGRPVKQGGFEKPYEAFDNSESYAEWKFFVPLPEKKPQS